MITSKSFDDWLEKFKREMIALEKMRATWDAGTNVTRTSYAFVPVVRLLVLRSGHY